MNKEHIWARGVAVATAGTAPKLGDLHRNEGRIETFQRNGTEAPVRAGEASSQEAELDTRSGLTMEAEGDVLSVQGDIDLHVAPVFRQRALEHIRAADRPQLDLNRVPFLDSAGLAVLLSLSREAKSVGKELRLKACGSPRRVLRITGIDRMLQLEE